VTLFESALKHPEEELLFPVGVECQTQNPIPIHQPKKKCQQSHQRKDMFKANSSDAVPARVAPFKGVKLIHQSKVCIQRYYFSRIW